MNSKGMVLVLSAIALLVAMPNIAVGQDEEAPQALSLWDVVTDNGFSILCFLLLTFSSIAAMALSIEHLVSIRRDKLIPPELVGEIEALLEDEEYGEAMDLCDQEPTLLTNIVGAVIPKIGAGYSVMAEAVREVGDEESIKLQQKISWLSLLGNIAPMLGLLGTVTGMIVAFQKIATAITPPKPAELAGGISTALLTTAFGLIIAIPTMACYFFFRNRVVKVSMEAYAICEDLIDRFRPQDG